MFETHKLNEAGFKAVANFKTAMSMAVSGALLEMPESREKAIFKTQMETAVFFGTKAIAADPKHHTEIVQYPETTTGAQEATA